MTRIALIAALSTAIAAPAIANTQLERTLGVAPGVYSFAELAAIKGSFDTDTGYTIPAPGGVVSTQSVGISPAHAQLAATLGLDAGDYSFAELAAIKGSFDSDTGYNASAPGGVVSTQSVGTSPAQAQLAAQLGLDAADYSFADLAAIKGAKGSSNE
ncbi:hypothetical protein Dshi_3135 [Dinoroseobacter shibae DFL 12 = DSM 16493]|jgi:hypothetical protein|uniref:Uncharacterized protein n=2 Tax=Dinoroseobacter shibae TaxID=215813 RepID=A8LLV9_DINSH|nr:hypothetical protein [Dinoroseobacter shibae]ABV93790.1 hypothetical protein Dshi_2053 [Dinoroseobacter shibae DFL 12 = DSM 16493]ABV94868.1 hypothetical protein Dshi_3135 [Dinoroseobacter shibae DFL 12 = DSM 16493]URF45243.1 hypothetical protein M8008_10625 [Dinoroseobacter shibae]URF46289.1 hypothetical protein M8008_16135 [Dinoroseobacter shibae]URF49548.1 hypothetical protein M8007_10625 [Dinoroseobacter shibae]